MPLPLVIGGLAAIAGVAGVGSGIHGGIKMKDANDTMKLAQEKADSAKEKFERAQKKTTELMDSVGKQELEILSNFENFSNLIEKIQGRPDFARYSKDGVSIPEYNTEELKEISVGAGVLLGGIGGAAVGAAGGFAASGATTAAVMALGTASTGTAISSLSGVAATNATLAALGGGAVAAGGGGMALGAAVLSGATLGIGLLVGGVIFNVTGGKLSEKADEAYEQAVETQKEVIKIVTYFDALSGAASKFQEMLTKVEVEYKKRLETLDYIINFSEKRQWSEFTDKEKQMTENLVLLVGMLYQMCKVELVLKNEEKNGQNTVNHSEINKAVSDAQTILENVEIFA